MHNKKLIILAILGTLAVFSLFYGIFTPPKIRRPPQVKESDIQLERKVPLSEEPILTKRVAKRTNYASWGRNPFTPKAISTATGLTGILWDDKIPKAIINDNVMGIGDKVDGKTVIDIQRDKVILNDGSKNFELRLGERQ